MKENDADIFVANKALKVISEEKLKKLLQPAELLKMGFSVKDLEE